MIETKNIIISNHTFERMQERFPSYSKNKKEATNHIRYLLKNSEYIGVVPDNEGSDGHMFAYDNKIAIYTDMSGGIVTTIYEIDRDNRQHISFRTKVKEIYKKEFRKMHRLEQTKRKKVELVRLKNEAEIAVLKYKRYMTRSNNVKKDCNEKIAALQSEITNIKNEVKMIQSEKRHVAIAIATNNF